MTRYGMVIDTKRCIACHACAMACKMENNLPNDVWWNRIMTVGGAMGMPRAARIPTWRCIT